MSDDVRKDVSEVLKDVVDGAGRDRALGVMIIVLLALSGVWPWAVAASAFVILLTVEWLDDKRIKKAVDKLI